jgi:hypothetical protein
MRRIALLVLPLLTLLPPAADALTVRDVIELTRAGLGEEILLALIEVDPSVFPIDTATLKMLKDAGVSERVIIAMVRSGRSQPPAPTEPATPVIIEETRAPEPQVVVIDHHDPPQVHEVPVAVPIYVPVPVSNRRVHVDDRVSHVPDPVDAGYRQDVRDGRAGGEHARPAQTYWGVGGQLRPDAWGQPPPAPVRKEKEKEKEKDKDR